MHNILANDDGTNGICISGYETYVYFPEHLEYHEGQNFINSWITFGSRTIKNVARRISAGVLFLPQLQSLELACEFYSPWKSLHQIFTLPHRQHLKVKIKTLFGHLLYHSKDENMKIVQELLEKGFDLSIVRPDSQIDWLRSYKEAHDL